MSRRCFLSASTAAAACGVSLTGCAAGRGAKKEGTQAPLSKQPAPPAATQDSEPRIRRYRTLGRTGFRVSDLSMGGAASDANVIRYVYDKGFNFFDTAEGYGDGEAERRIGQAMKHMDRSKIFIATKLVLKAEDGEQNVLDRFGKCLERMQTPYADALYLHAVERVEDVKHPTFHAAVKKLKADSKLKYVGISCHGPREEKDATMEQVLLAAVEDGRFDLMLFAYNFMKAEEGERILRACHERNVGTTAMKVGAGRLEIEPFDPENPSEEYSKMLARLTGRGMTREAAVQRIKDYLTYAQEEMKKNRPLIEPFMAKHGLKTQDELDRTCVQWALRNPDMHTVVLSLPDFDRVDFFLPLSGTELTAAGEQFLREYQAAFGNQYCRHGCVACAGTCPNGLPVSTIMRYAYYFLRQGREKHAMQKYARLSGRDGSLCLDCSAPCRNACPHGVSIQASLLRAHAVLTMA